MENKTWATFLRILGIFFLLPSVFAIIIFTLSMGSTHLHVQGAPDVFTQKPYTLWKLYFPDFTAIYVGLIALTGALLLKNDK